VASIEDLLQSLIDSVPSLAGSDELQDAFVMNISSMVEDARAFYDTGHPSSLVSDRAFAEEHLETGALTASHLHHPAEAMATAEILFDDYLPTFVEEVGAVTATDLIRAARALHAGIWRRFPAGAVAYTAALRERVSNAHLEVRSQIARDLHDRIAHGILAGVQRIDLIALANPSPLERAHQLDAAATDLRRVLQEVQDLAVTLHARVAGEHLDAAVHRHVTDVFMNGVPPTIVSNGTPESLPNWQAEEALTIVLEALANQRKHAPGAVSSVTFDWSEVAVVVTIRDDGPGFDPAHEQAGRLGQRTMRERAGVIGARFDVESAPGSGTTVRLTIPRGTL
jgi:signal transduction histidine kinase